MKKLNSFEQNEIKQLEKITAGDTGMGMNYFGSTVQVPTTIEGNSDFGDVWMDNDENGEWSCGDTYAIFKL